MKYIKEFILPGIVGFICSIVSLPYIIEFFEHRFHWFTAGLAGVLSSMFIGYVIFSILYILFRLIKNKK